MSPNNTQHYSSIEIKSKGSICHSIRQVLRILEDARGIQCHVTRGADEGGKNLLGFLTDLSTTLEVRGFDRESATLKDVLSICTSNPDFGGYDLNTESHLDAKNEADILFLCAAWFEALNSADRAKKPVTPLTSRPVGRRGMTMTEKIFAMHDTAKKGFVQPGDIIQVDVDWVLASELSWGGIEKVYDAIGKPGIYRNDRFWLAGDHRVEPPLYHVPKVRALMDSSERAKESFRMTEFQGFNYTIMHTEFFRERAQPGMLVIGADSHSCSAGAISCLSVGMGGTDVAMPLVTGQTWFSVPETVNLRLINRPPPGVGGKDTILYILKEFKRNTIAADRVVEFTGPGLEYLSCDARFAIANMTTEFGGITGIFESDQRTFDFVNRRRLKKHKSSALYFRPDSDAQYWKTFEVDLANVESFVALFPSPDNVVPVDEVIGKKLDGCFIGACTTAEEDLVIGAMVLEEAMKQGSKPVRSGKRLIVPGSKPIRHKMVKLGLIEIYERAGFAVGVPGCSMCVGQGMDQAGEGEVWLSSQNRNFENRMGKGSIANLGSAATVAASSLNMEITDPQPLLNRIDQERLKRYLGFNPFLEEVSTGVGSIEYVEPYGEDSLARDTVESKNHSSSEPAETKGTEATAEDPCIEGKVLKLADFIDTDAIIPSDFLMGTASNEEFGAHCMQYFMPEFRQQVKDGLNIIVAGTAFGCGSSREVAVNALMGAGVQCVIAKSFAFIYARNQPNIGLLGITIPDDEFHALAQQGVDVTVDLASSKVVCGGKDFSFLLSDMEKQLIAAGGITEAFGKFGKKLFDVMCGTSRPSRGPRESTLKDIESL